VGGEREIFETKAVSAFLKRGVFYEEKKSLETGGENE